MRCGATAAPATAPTHTAAQAAIQAAIQTLEPHRSVAFLERLHLHSRVLRVQQANPRGEATVAPHATDTVPTVCPAAARDPRHLSVRCGATRTRRGALLSFLERRVAQERNLRCQG